MNVLVLNSGSSSIKFKLFRAADWSTLAGGALTRIGESRPGLRYHWIDPSGTRREGEESRAVDDHRAGLGTIMETLEDTGILAGGRQPAAIGHRVVHGGEAFAAPARIDDEAMGVIRAAIPLAPLHNPANLEGIRVARELFPEVPQVAVFDTAFHQTLPPAAYRYAVPEALYREHRVRRYGFHGTSHQYVARRAAARLGKPLSHIRLVTLHLGNGASAAAIDGGRAVDTSMGMTPLEGLVMGTRSGDVDPGVLFYLQREAGYDTAALDRLLNEQSGLLGLAGVGDMREIHQRAEAGDERAALAREVAALRLKKYIGAYCAELGRVDALVFTGGIGENDAWTRARACSGLQAFGIELDPGANADVHDEERTISAAQSPVAVLVIPTDEELEIGRQTWETVDSGASPS